MSDGDQGRLAGPRVLLVLARGGRQGASVEEDGPGQRRDASRRPRLLRLRRRGSAGAYSAIGCGDPHAALRFVWKLSRFVDE